MVDWNAAMLPLHQGLRSEISELPGGLEAWRRKLHPAIRPGWSEQAAAGMVALPLAILQLEFYSTVCIVHRAIASEASRRKTAGP